LTSATRRTIAVISGAAVAEGNSHVLGSGGDADAARITTTVRLGCISLATMIRNATPYDASRQQKNDNATPYDRNKMLL
jgi:hypothetical protein